MHKRNTFLLPNVYCFNAHKPLSLLMTPLSLLILPRSLLMPAFLESQIITIMIFITNKIKEINSSCVMCCTRFTN